jgi:AraC-like DNA-binding protein
MSKAKAAPLQQLPGPPTPAFRKLSTRSVAAGERFDFWRSLFPGLDIRSRPDDADAPFWGELAQHVGPQGVSLSQIRVDASVNRYCASASDGSFILARVTSGFVELGDRAGSSLAATGGLFLIDTSRAVPTRNTRYAFECLKLPRPLILEALGGDPSPSQGFSSLGTERLAPFLSSQMQLFCERGDGLDRGEREAALEATLGLALSILRHRLRGKLPARDVHGQGLFAAAKLYIDRHLHRAALTPEQVAAEVGCSRARLYRLFAERDLGVFEHIRERRLQRSCELLAASPPREVGAIAFDCGYVDPPAFNRAFKRRFGMNPSEWRAARAAEASARRLEEPN